jgi:dihydroorotate dehydrogenase electron transfer subunit
MKKRAEDLRITDKAELESNYFYFELQSEKAFEKIIPGQFVNILVSGSPSTFLRRPFSIHYVDYSKNTLQLLIKVVGEGTRFLSGMKKGDKLNVLYPLGNGFTIKTENNALLIGGGYGIAPLYHLGDELIKAGGKVSFLLGARTKTDLVMLERYKQLSELFVTTEDGSLGFQGKVLDHPELETNHFSSIFTCGPEPMMKAVASFAKSRQTNCEVSLDQIMGCGIGVCLSCVAKTVRGHETSCIHGPIFNTKELVW